MYYEYKIENIYYIFGLVFNIFVKDIYFIFYKKMMLFVFMYLKI